jgi:hypothetical protein
MVLLTSKPQMRLLVSYYINLKLQKSLDPLSGVMTESKYLFVEGGKPVFFVVLLRQ